MKPTLRKAIKVTSLCVAVLAVVAMLGALLLWLFRIQTLNKVAKGYLRDFGLEDAQFTIREFDLKVLHLEDISLSQGEIDLEITRLQLTYNLEDLLKEKRIRELVMSGAKVHYAYTLAENEEEEPTAIPSLEELVSLLDISDFSPIPFDRIQIKDSQFTANINDQSFAAMVEADFTTLSTSALSATAELKHPSATLRISAVWDTLERATVSSNFSSQNPIALLDSYVGNWRSEAPELLAVTMGPLNAQVDLLVNEEQSPTLDVTFEQRAINFVYEEIKASLPLIAASSRIKSLDQITAQLEAEVEKLQRDTIALNPESPIRTSISLSKFSVVDFLTQNPLHWIYDQGFITGESAVQLSYDLEKIDLPLTAEVVTQNTQINDFRVDPFTLSIEGNLEQLAFTSSPLNLSEYANVTLENGNGTLLIPEEDSEPVSLSFSGRAMPLGLSSDETSLALPPISLSLTTEVFENSTHSIIQAFNEGGAVIADWEDRAKVNGRLELMLDLNKDSETELSSGFVSFNVTDSSIQSEQLNSNGIAIQGKSSFKNLDTGQLAEVEFSDEEQLQALLGQFITTLDWQANEFSLPNLQAQWNGGSLALDNRDGELVADITFGSGILKSDVIRLDQVYLESKSKGTLTSLESTSTIFAMLEGNSINLSTRQTIDSPLSELSLSGEYKLETLEILHSDLPARFLPELAGLSVSAALEANGGFNYSDKGADASLTLKMRNGSVDYPASQLRAQDMELDFSLDSLAKLDSGEEGSRLLIRDIRAGDATATNALASFRLQGGNLIRFDQAEVEVFGGKTRLETDGIPIDGSDFQGALNFDGISLREIANYTEIFDGEMEGQLSGKLPFRMKDGSFELLRGELSLPEGSTASLRYNTKGLLTGNQDEGPPQKPTLSERLLKFLKIDPDRTAEEALGNISVKRFDAELFPENSPNTPILINLEGTAHSEMGDIPVNISTQVFGSLSELYNFLIRLNSL